MDPDQAMTELHNEINQFIMNKLQDNHAPLSVAAALITNALRVYRTVLTEEDYQSVMEMIQERRNEVDPYLPSVLQ
jgi:PHD/YefM family antitoxin component YafN of YafNO toxin-antitoxin module